MWDGKVVEVVPITCFVIKPWELLLRLLMPCYACKRGLGFRVFMTDVRLLFNGLFKVASLTHIWVD